MKITNKHNFPDVIVAAVSKDEYSSTGNISVTTLIDSPQVRMLKIKHAEELTMDVSEMFFAFVGTCLHNKFEEADKENDFGYPVIAERRLEVEIEGWIVSGAQDRVLPTKKKLQDYKYCSVWTYIYPEGIKKFAAQQNTYAYMIRENGGECDSAEVIMMFRDFSASKAKTTHDYPKSIIETVNIKLEDHQKMHEYIVKRVKLHQAAEAGDIPECTTKERWASPDRYAVMKKGNKRALKVMDEEFLADEMIENHKDSKILYKEFRPGNSLRCESYCPVADVCPQRKKELEMLDNN